MNKLDLLLNKRGFTGPTFSFENRLKRVLWKITWLIAARWTPPQAHRWRIALLRMFGAQVSWKAYIYPNVEIWAPWNLAVEDYGTLARGVICYNIAPVNIGIRAIVSQGVHLCTGTHDYLDPAFPLAAKPISIGRRAWVCADAFVGPGVLISEGAILAAAAVAHRDLQPWAIYAGNPATFLRSRPEIND
ncbi:MAG: putative colanic acid biosynthesis acetyltransferase [Cytophaga sp.]|nr:putative colanic acid biosynthesis acetyltransferase [Undibacterium sp.]